MPMTPMCPQMKDTSKFFKRGDDMLAPMKCTSFNSCFSCGWTKRVSDNRRKELRIREANGTLIDTALKARALARLEKDLTTGEAKYGDIVDGGACLRWKHMGTVYR